MISGEFTTELEQVREAARAIALKLLEVGGRIDPVAQLELDGVVVELITLAKTARALSRQTIVQTLRRPPTSGVPLCPSIN